MNLLMYFCIPLVVTGQAIGNTGQVGKGNENVKEVGSPETSETELYSKYAYGSQVQYKNPLDEFIIDAQGQYVRRPSVIEDSGEVGKPSIYNTNGASVRNNDHPSFIVSNVYASIVNKKNGGTKTSHPQMPSPLAYGAPSPQDPSRAVLVSSHEHQHQHHQHLQEVGGVAHEKLSPVVQQLVPQQHNVLLQDPHSGQLVQSHVYQNGLVPLYHSQVAPQLSYVSDGVHHSHGGHVISQEIPVAQKVVPAIKTAGVALYQQQLVGNAIAPEHHHQVLVKAPYYLHNGVAPASPHLVKATGEEIHGDPLLKTEAAQYYHYPQQLLRTASVPLYQTPAVKTSEALVYQEPVLKTSVPAHPTPLLKSAEAPLYYHPTLLKGADGQLYHGHVLKHGSPPVLLKSPDQPIYQTQYVNAAGQPLLLKSPTGELYHQNAVGAPVLHHQLHSPVVLKDAAVPVYQHPTLNDATAHALLKSSVPTAHDHHHVHHHHDHGAKTALPLLQQHILKTAAVPLATPLLKSPEVEATIVPGIEEHAHGIQHQAYIPLFAQKHPHAQYVTVDGTTLLAPNYPKILVQKAVLQKSPVLTEKAVLKNALSPVYTNPAVDTHNAIFKAPLTNHYVQKDFLEPGLPGRILTSQKALVNTLISSDNGKLRGGKAVDLFAGKTNLELVPSVSYGYSYSLYPGSNGQYGPPQHSHRHHK